MTYKPGFASAAAQPTAESAGVGQLRLEDSSMSGADSSRLASSLTGDPRMMVLRGTLLALVRRDGRDLTARQLTAFLTVYMDDVTHTVSSLAELLHISRPGVTRIMDRLVQFDLVAREEDREDRRRVLVRRTTRGAAFFRELVAITRAVAEETEAVAAA
jgi:DNA-binding MarR family transcriptional regulator